MTDHAFSIFSSKFFFTVYRQKKEERKTATVQVLCVCVRPVQGKLKDSFSSDTNFMYEKKLASCVSSRVALEKENSTLRVAYGCT